MLCPGLIMAAVARSHRFQQPMLFCSILCVYQMVPLCTKLQLSSGLNKIAIPRESHADPDVAALKKKRVVVEQFFGRMTVLWTSLLIPYRFTLDTLDTDVDVMILLTNENIKLDNMNAEDLKNHQKYLGLLAENAAKATAKAEKKREKAKATAAKRARFSKNGPDEPTESHFTTSTS